MSAPFSRSLRALGAEGAGGGPVVLAVAIVLLAGWIAWAFFGRVTVWAVTPDARVEVAAAAHPVTATEAGRVEASTLALGRVVAAGEVLVELDRALQERALAEETARRAALEAELGALRVELEGARALVGTSEATGSAAVAEAEARAAQAEATARLAEERAERLAGLAAGRQVSELELSQARAEASAARAAADALRTGLSREGLERRGDAGDREVRVAALAREIAGLEGALATSDVTRSRLEAALERRTIRAPVAGKVAEAPTLAPGSFLAEGALVATVVPDGDLRVVGTFAPSEALGRVRVGQPARLRLDGFPWTWFGTVPATVAAVADEVRDGGVRVELHPEPLAESPIRLQHGLPGAVEIAVEEVTPAELVLRAAGRLLAPPEPEP